MQHYLCKIGQYRFLIMTRLFSNGFFLKQVALTEGKFQNPPRCAVKSCNGKLFAPLKKHFMTKVVEWQRMK